MDFFVNEFLSKESKQKKKKQKLLIHIQQVLYELVAKQQQELWNDKISDIYFRKLYNENYHIQNKNNRQHMRRQFEERYYRDQYKNKEICEYVFKGWIDLFHLYSICTI